MRRQGFRSAHSFFQTLVHAFVALLLAAVPATSAWANHSVIAFASKTTDATGTTVVEGSFSIAQGQTVFWTAQYTGGPTAGNDFYLSTTGSNMATIPLTTSGQLGGSKLLAAGTYYISIKTFLMGPGSYTVKYDPSGNGAHNGDPHVTTVNGVHYDFQSAGEFVALRDDKGMEIQTRQTPVSSAGSLTDPYSGLTTGVSINTAVAVRMGQRRVSLQFDPGPQSTDTRLRIRVDGQVARLTADGIAMGPDGRISPAGEGAVRLDFANGTVLVVTPGWWEPHRRWYLNLDVQHTPAHKGIMGTVVGRSWLPALPDASLFGPRPTALRQRYRQLYERFANAWRVTPQTSLFDYAPGESTQTFTTRDWPRMRGPYLVPGSQPVPMTPLRVALAACRGIADAITRRDCVFDVRVMGDPGVAKTYERLQRLRREAGARAQ